MPKTKIVCTIGPSTWDIKVLKEMIGAGMTVARVNGAFANPEELDKVSNLIRSISQDVSLMVDVKGPEIRLNKFPEPIRIKKGDIIKIGNTENAHIYPANYKDVYKFLKKGDRLVVGDGDVSLIVEEIKGTDIYAYVESGEILKPGKALNIPNVNYSSTVLTDKDYVNLEHALKTGWDMVSASFIQSKDAALQVREVIGNNMFLVAKIEDKKGVDNIREILEVVDGIMIARGGLGVELGLEQVPIVERLLIKECRAVGKPVITATQMLESMTDKPYPTRAEVNDIATAVLLGTDALMLSGETSAGKYPVEAVQTMAKTASYVENHLEPEIIDSKSYISVTGDAIAKAAAVLANDLQDVIKAVAVVSFSGATVRSLVRHTLKQDVYAFVSNGFYKKTLNISRNVRAFVLYDEGQSAILQRDKAIDFVIDKLKRFTPLTEGDRVLLLGKTPINGREFFPNVFEIITL